MRLRHWRRATWAGAVVVLVLACATDPAPNIEVALADGGDAHGFVLENASGATWSDVRIEVQGLRPDGADDVCQEATFAQWAAGETKQFRRCGEKTRLTIRVGEQSGTFVVAGSALFRRIGRREIQLQGG